MKNPMLAAALNGVPLGLGYLYLGRPIGWAVTCFLGLVLGFASLLVAADFAFAASSDFLCSSKSIGGCIHLTLAGAVLMSLDGSTPLVPLVAITGWDVWRKASVDVRSSSAVVGVVLSLTVLEVVLFAFIVSLNSFYS